MIYPNEPSAGAVAGASAGAAHARETILHATSVAAEHLLQGDLATPRIHEVLRLLGEATDVSRVYIFDVHPAPTGQRLSSQLFEWCADGYEPQIANPQLQKVDMDACGYTRWLDELSANRPVYGLVADFPASEQAMLREQGILSLVVMPILASGRLWGFIGFDDCARAQPWTADVVACLGVTARVLAAALERVDLKRHHASLVRDYEQLLANINDVVFRANAAGQWTFLSRAWSTLRGGTVGGAIGRCWDEFVEPEDRPVVQAVWAGLEVDDPRGGRCEVRLRGADGVARWVLLNVRRLGADVAGTITDIHEVKTAQQSMERARELAESANRAKTDFLSTMSHELRTPLNAVIGLTESLLEQPAPVDPARSRRYLELIRQSGRQLLGMINGILELARIEAGRLRLEPAALDVERLLRVVCEGLRAEADAHGIDLKMEVPSPPLALTGDERMLRSVLHNLVSNAIKFTPKEGRVRLRAAAPAPGLVAFAVEDTGIGIAAEKQRLVFQPFEQVDSSLSRTYSGSGLGLTLVDRIVRLHGGTVRLDSAIGRGSTFTVHLPATGPLAS